MNDVLPKPFTKEGLLHMLEKHLVHLKKPMAQADGTMVAPQPVQIARQLVLKEEDSPAKSPQTVSNWNSPSQMPGVSPVGSTVPDDFAQAMRPTSAAPKSVRGQFHACEYGIQHIATHADATTATTTSSSSL